MGRMGCIPILPIKCYGDGDGVAGVNRALNRFPVPQRFTFQLIILSRLSPNFSHAL